MPPYAAMIKNNSFAMRYLGRGLKSIEKLVAEYLLPDMSPD